MAGSVGEGGEAPPFGCVHLYLGSGVRGLFVCVGDLFSHLSLGSLHTHVHTHTPFGNLQTHTHIHAQTHTHLLVA